MIELFIAAKAALILILGLAAAALGRRCRASRRHMMLAVTFCAVLVLPAAAVLIPAVRLEIPLAGMTDSPTPADPPVVPSVQRDTREIVSVTRTVHTGDNGIEALLAARAVWVVVAMALLLQIGVSQWRLRRLRRNALPWMESGIAALATEAGIEKCIEVLLHGEVAAPLTLGLRRPAILMPVGAPQWQRSDIVRALVHELEHIRRRDWPVQMAARIACAVYWFLPLSWIAWRRLCLEAERSCDDAVLRSADSAEYADQLVQLARRLSGATAPALAMANRSDLSARVHSILDCSIRRGRVGWLPALSSVVAALVLVVGISPVVPAIVSAAQNRPAQVRIRALDRALIEAAQAGDIRDITELLNAGANVNCAVDGDGSPLIVAARRAPIEAVQLLLERGADVNQAVEGDGNPLIAASATGRLPIVELLLKHGARIEDVVPGDENALIQASASGHLPVVKLLVSRGANVNARVQAGGIRGSEWRTPLTMAVRGRHLEVVSFLKIAGATE